MHHILTSLEGEGVHLVYRPIFQSLVRKYTVQTGLAAGIVLHMNHSFQWYEIKCIKIVNPYSFVIRALRRLRVTTWLGIKGPVICSFVRLHFTLFFCLFRVRLICSSGVEITAKCKQTYLNRIFGSIFVCLLWSCQYRLWFTWFHF